MSFHTYREESCDPKHNAQRNLIGRTHYVDDDTLRFHHARILHTYITDGGLLFALVESYAADYQNTDRRKRAVIFDVSGYVVYRPELEDGYKTTDAATKDMWKALNNLDAIQVTSLQ